MKARPSCIHETTESGVRAMEKTTEKGTASHRSPKARAAIGAAVATGCLVLAGLGAGVSASASEQAQDAAADGSEVAQEALEYCGMCHFKTAVESGSVASFNSTNVNRAMVESMVPMLDDETINALADYFAQIEPAEDEA